MWPLYGEILSANSSAAATGIHPPAPGITSHSAVCQRLTSPACRQRSHFTLGEVFQVLCQLKRRCGPVPKRQDVGNAVSMSDPCRPIGIMFVRQICRAGYCGNESVEISRSSSAVRVTSSECDDVVRSFALKLNAIDHSRRSRHCLNREHWRLGQRRGFEHLKSD